MRLRFTGVLWIGLVFLAPSNGQEKNWPVERGPARELVKYAVNFEAIQKAPADFLADYPAFYVFAATSYHIEADGTVECTTHEIIRLNNRKGIDQSGEHRSITFTPAHEKLILNEARVIKSDRRSVAVEARNVQLRDVPTDYSVYDTSKELIISFPGLEVGDLIEVIWTTRGKNPEYAGEFFTRYHFGEDKYPIWNEAFGVCVAKGKTLKYAIINPNLLPNPKLQPEMTDEDGAKVYIWRVADRRPVVKEDRLPSKEELRPGVAISTFPSWEAVAEWERKARADCDECPPELKEIVRRVKQEHQSTEAVARELTYWFRSNIRYISTGDRHDFTPHPPALVYKNRFGDCKDGVQFLYVLLREAGIPSGSVSLSPVGDGQILEEVPCPWSTHALVNVRIGRKDHWIDTTSAHSGWDFLPFNDCDRVCYIVGDKDFRFTETPKFTADDNRTEAVTHMKFDADGTSHDVRTVEYFGEAALQKRDEWLDVSAKERRRLIRNDLMETYSRVRVNDIDIDEKNLRRFDEPVRARVTFDVPKQLHGMGTLEGTISDSSLWGSLLGITIDPDRESPLELKEPFESKHRFVIEAPKGFQLDDPPEEKDVTSKWASFSVTVKVDRNGRRWTIDYQTRLELTRVNKADLVDFRKFQEDVQAALHVEVTLKPIEDN